MICVKRLGARARLPKTLKAVSWSFFGVRKSSGQAQDVAKINPVHLIVAGLIGGAMFVGTLVLLVRWVVTSGVAH